jgi:transposase
VPVLRVISTSVKGHTLTHPQDMPYGQAPVRLVWHKRRWPCRERACPRTSFTESLPAVPARARLTARLKGDYGAGIAERFSCVLAGAAHYRVSWPVAHRAYVAHVAGQLAEPLPAVSVLGIDETRRRKPKWQQDQATGRWQIAHDRWHTGVVDAHGTAGLLPHIDGRTAAAVAEWLAAQPLGWRQGITHVAIDLSASPMPARWPTPCPARSWSPTGSTWSTSQATWSPRSASTPPGGPAAGGAATATRSGPGGAGC